MSQQDKGALCLRQAASAAPHTMRAAELDQWADLANGIVTEELRKGYTWQDKLLRLTEVKDNRRPEPETDFCNG